jgi:hypothetical protein
MQFIELLDDEKQADIKQRSARKLVSKDSDILSWPVASARRCKAGGIGNGSFFGMYVPGRSYYYM